MPVLIIPKTSRTWLNRHFVFTHGYGFTLSPVNTKALDGLPDYFIRDLGESTRIDGSPTLKIKRSDVVKYIPIGRAALYFGILPSPYAIAPTKLQEFDYPVGDQNIYTHYRGSGGIQLSSLLSKIASSVYLFEPRLLNTGALTNDSKLLLRRDVRQRVKAIAPFITISGDPYLVSVRPNSFPQGYSKDQNQYWIVEGYTSSRTYPYASVPPDGIPITYILVSLMIQLLEAGLVYSLASSKI